MHRFGPTDYEDPSKALTRLKQVTTIAAYQESFEKLSHHIDDLPKSFLISCFIAGLRDKICLDVKVKQPKTLADTIGVAHLIEDRNFLQKQTSNYVVPRRLRHHNGHHLIHLLVSLVHRQTRNQLPKILQLQSVRSQGKKQRNVGKKAFVIIVMTSSYHAINEVNRNSS